MRLAKMKLLSVNSDNLNIISEDVTPLNKIKSHIVAGIDASELRLKYDQKNQFIYAFWISLIVSVVSFFALLDEISEYWLFPFISMCVCVGAFFIQKFMSNKLWELNRKEQTIKIPFALKRKTTLKRVSDIQSGYFIQTGGKYATVPTVVPVVWHNSKLLFCNASSLTTWMDKDHKGSDTARTWSFYIWYLDKNRPLPPGDMLDPFREEDFQRRKAEGFPPPLFCSCIPTAEATPEQQAEREKYWKDEDYIFRLDRYLEPSLWGGFKGKGTSSLRLEENAEIINMKNNPQ